MSAPEIAGIQRASGIGALAVCSDVVTGVRELCSALVEAARNNDVDGIEDLVRRAAPIDAIDPTTRETALIMAVEHESLEAVRALLRLGAKVNARNADGVTPLYNAVDIGVQAAIKRFEMHEDEGNVDLRVVEVLLGAGADPATENSDGCRSQCARILSAEAA